jgi:tRNA-splicing ligase RtcB
MQVITEGVQRPIKCWATDLEHDCLKQAENLANLPFTFKHVALMPDTHFGYGMPIGGVLAAEGAVIPNAVGVDIGCGMCAMQTDISEWTDTQLKEVLNIIRRSVPTGFKKHKTPKHALLMPAPRHNDNTPVLDENYSKALKSLGTLGGGNHFIELQTDGSHLWAMIHSGSRNLGLQVAKHYNALAKDLNAQWHTVVPPGWDLAFLPLDTPQATQYLVEMQYCVDFALANRRAMMNSVAVALAEVFNIYETEPLINIAHNYATMENHFGHNVMVHRKGATLAREGTDGIIPGSQGTSSYIVVGKGNPESFQSCSHGAGRCMGRKQAQRELNVEHEQARMEGIIHSVRGEKDLDEAPSAYKDINQVMANQSDLVDIVTKLSPLAVVKG